MYFTGSGLGLKFSFFKCKSFTERSYTWREMLKFNRCGYILKTFQCFTNKIDFVRHYCHLKKNKNCLNCFDTVRKVAAMFDFHCCWNWRCISREIWRASVWSFQPIMPDVWFRHHTIDHKTTIKNNKGLISCIIKAPFHHHGNIF